MRAGLEAALDRCEKNAILGKDAAGDECAEHPPRFGERTEGIHRAPRQPELSDHCTAAGRAGGEDALNEAQGVGEREQQMGVGMVVEVATDVGTPHRPQDPLLDSMKDLIQPRFGSEVSRGETRETLADFVDASFLARILAERVRMNLGKVVGLEGVFDWNLPVHIETDLHADRGSPLGPESLLAEPKKGTHLRLEAVCFRVQADEEKLTTSLEPVNGKGVRLSVDRREVFRRGDPARSSVGAELPAVVGADELAVGSPWRIAQEAVAVRADVGQRHDFPVEVSKLNRAAEQVHGDEVAIVLEVRQGADQMPGWIQQLPLLGREVIAARVGLWREQVRKAAPRRSADRCFLQSPRTLRTGYAGAQVPAAIVGAPGMEPSENARMNAYLHRIFRDTEEENRGVILGMLEPNPKARLLDLGCYDGVLTRRLAAAVGTSDVTGVEVGEEAAARALAGGLKVVRANLNEPLPLPSASFDAIHANQVIEHLYDTDRFVAEIRRLLAPGGYAILSTNNLASLHNIGSLVLGRQPPPCHVSNKVVVGNPLNPFEGRAHESAAMAHLRLFSYYGLRDFLGLQGLEPEVYRTVGFYPFPPALGRGLCRVLPVYGAYLTCRVRASGPNP